jgi:glycerophosphoryl diester phosphodiesterase
VSERAEHLPPLKRVGHKGAGHVSPGNTLASFEAALEHGVDMIEFDVLRLRDGRLVLAHDYDDGKRADALTLDEGLDHFAGEAYADVELNVDLKLPGYEREVMDGLSARGLADRALISTHYLESIELIGELHPGQRRGLSVPKLSSDPTKSPWKKPFALAVAAVAKRLLPLNARRMIRAGRFEALMCHWRLVSPALVRAVHGAGGQLYVWTVDDADHIARLSAIGVDGVISNDPRLFSQQLGASS